MPGTARPGRSRRAARTASVLAAFSVVVTLVAAGTPGGAGDDPATVPEAAAAGPSPTPSPSPTADPLAAPAGPSGIPGGAAPDDARSAPGGAAGPPASAGPAPAPPAKAAETLTTAGARARKVTDATKDWASFTLLDRRTGKVVGDRRSAEVTHSESTVKAWLAADLLATRARQGSALTAYETLRMTRMIRESDDNAAEVIWRWLGADNAIRDMIRTCRLQDTRVFPDWWSKTWISSRDLARLGDCIVPGPGKFLSPRVGAPLIRLMRSVGKSNAFGIEQAAPAGKGARIAVKNGWTQHGGGAGGQWNVNCLGIWGPDSRWVLAVTTRYPSGNGLGYGAAVCRRVTTTLFPLVNTG